MGPEGRGRGFFLCRPARRRATAPGNRDPSPDTALAGRRSLFLNRPVAGRRCRTGALGAVAGAADAKRRPAPRPGASVLRDDSAPGWRRGTSRHGRRSVRGPSSWPPAGVVVGNRPLGRRALPGPALCAATGDSFAKAYERVAGGVLGFLRPGVSLSILSPAAPFPWSVSFPRRFREARGTEGRGRGFFCAGRHGEGQRLQGADVPVHHAVHALRLLCSLPLPVLPLCGVRGDVLAHNARESCARLGDVAMLPVLSLFSPVRRPPSWFRRSSRAGSSRRGGPPGARGVPRMSSGPAPVRPRTPHRVTRVVRP